MHGTAHSEEAWAALNEWDQGYWYGVAEFVLDYYDERAP
jgi:hypothetical protein